MLNRSQRGFVLPLSLMLASTILVLTTLLLNQSYYSAEANQHIALRQRTRASLRFNVAAMVQRLERLILTSASSSALLPLGEAYRTVAVQSEEDSPVPLYSTLSFTKEKDIVFKSPYSTTSIVAGFQSIAPDSPSTEMELAWAFEDLSLNPTAAQPPATWPLPAWNYSPVHESKPVQEFLDGPWIAIDEPLPFLPGKSPALVPVVSWMGLRMGIFASGINGSREKVIRIRYYLEGAIWNPYNRQLQMHSGTGRKASFQIIIWNLPDVRITNISRGISTGWLRFDEATNSGTGAKGIHAWITTNAILEPGTVSEFLDPDPKWQPEGLARTLHPAFMVGPADRILIEFNPPENGARAACLSISTDNPLQAAIDGEGWYRIEDFPIEIEKLEFDRADDAPRPFYLAGGSLAFRQDNAHLQIALKRPPQRMDKLIDPRRRRIGFHETFLDAAGSSIPGSDLLSLEIRRLNSDPVADIPIHDRKAWFSWPATEPETVLSATDLPQWKEGFRLGSPGATRLNRLLDETPLNDFPTETIELLSLKEDLELPYESTVSINMLSSTQWESLLISSSRKSGKQPGNYFPLYPESVDAIDFRKWEIHEIRQAANKIVTAVREEPAISIADFFNRGILAEAFSTDQPVDALDQLLPLRGWLRESPPFRRHGSAWVLHLAIRAKEDQQSVQLSARVWLLESDNERGNFEIVRFEWTSPSDHCLPYLAKS